MDAAKCNKKKKIRRKVVSIRCRKISSNRSHLSVSHGAGYKYRIKTLSKNNRDLASALTDTKCDLENCKQSLNRIKCARIKMFEMHKNLKSFMKDFEEAFVLLNSDDYNWLAPTSSVKGLKNITKNLIEPVEEVTETESMMEEQLNIEEPNANHAETLESTITHEPKNLILPDKISEAFRPINLQPKDKLGTETQETNSPSLATVKENRDSATPKFSLPSPIINRFNPESGICLDCKDDGLPPFENNSEIVVDSSIKTCKKFVNNSKIPRIFGFCKSKKSFGKKNNFDKILTINTDNTTKVCEELNFSQGITKSHEISCSQSLYNNDQFDKAMITNTDNVNKSQSNASQQINFIKIPEKPCSSSVLSNNYDVSREVYVKDNANTLHDDVSKEVYMIDSANTLQVSSEKSARRNTFVIKKKGNIVDPPIEDNIDRRKTFVKKSPKIKMKANSDKNRTDTFTSHQKWKNYEKCNDKRKKHVDITSKCENIQLNELNIIAKFAESCPKVDSMVKTVVNIDPEYSNVKQCVNLPLKTNAVSQSAAFESDFRMINIDAEKSENTELFYNEMNFDVCENTFATECSPLELEKGIENSLKIREKSFAKELKAKHKTENVKNLENEIFPNKTSFDACENTFTTECSYLELEKGIEDSLKGREKSLVKKLETKKTTENIKDLQNENPSNNILKTAKSIKILEKVPNEVAINLEKDLQIKIDKFDSCRININTIKANELENNIVDKTLENLQNEAQINETIKFQRKSMNVKKNGSNSVDIQVFENPKIEDCTYETKDDKQISHDYLISSFESESESYSHIDDINGASSIKTTPIRKQCSNSKNKKFVFCTNKKKSILRNYTRKSRTSNIHEDDNKSKKLHHDKFDIVSEKLSDSNTNPTRNSKRHWKTVTFDEDNTMDIGPNENESRKYNEMLKEIQIPVIIEENTKSENLLNGNIKEKNMLKLNTSNNRNNISTEVTSNFVQGKNKEFDHINIERIVCIDNTEVSEINTNKIKKVLYSRKGRKVKKRKSCDEENNSNCDPDQGKKTKHKIKTKEYKLSKIAIASDNENVKNADVDGTCIDTLSKIKTKQQALKKVKESSIPKKNTLYVSAEIHPPPYSLQLSEVALKGKEKPVRTHKRLSVVLNDVFDLENINRVNISGDREAFLKGETSFPLKTSLSDNSDNIQSTVNNPKNKKSTNNLDCQDVKSRRRGKPVTYKEPSLIKKLRR